MKYGEVFDYRTAEEAKKFIGTRGVFSDSLKGISDRPADCEVLVLREIEEVDSYPFGDEYKEMFQFFRPILEEDERMTNRQLSEWLAKGNGEYSREEISTATSNREYLKVEEDVPVRDDILIRRWKDTEWVKPTKAIYEEDCK